MAYKMSDIVRDAFVRSAVLADGQTPNATQASRGFQYLTDIYKGLAANGTLATLKDVFPQPGCNPNTPGCPPPTPGVYTAKENERVYFDATNITSVAIPATITDHYTGQTRAPRDGAVISVVNLPSNALPQFWVYDAATATWEDLYAATLPTSIAPLSFSYHKDLVDVLAVVLAAKGGIPIDQELASAAVAARIHLTKRGSDRTQKQRVQYF